MQPHTPHPAESLILSRLSANVIERLARIRLMAFDVDGILTDGALYYDANGETLKRFHALDGQGLRLLGNSGITVVLVTARGGPIVTRRAADLGINDVYHGAHDKLAVLLELSQKRGLSTDSIGFMGDDLNDLPALRHAGFAATVPEAPGYIAQVAHWVSSRPGGHGAVRECCDLLLAAQGRLAALVQSGLRQTPESGTLQ